MRKFIALCTLCIILITGALFIAALSGNSERLQDAYIAITIDHNKRYFEILDVHKDLSNDTHLVRFKNVPDKYYAIRYSKKATICETMWLSEWLTQDEYQQLMESTYFEETVYEDGMFDTLRRDQYNVRVVDDKELVLYKLYEIVGRDAYVIFYDSNNPKRYALVFSKPRIETSLDWLSNIYSVSEWDIYYHDCELRL